MDKIEEYRTMPSYIEALYRRNISEQSLLAMTRLGITEEMLIEKIGIRAQVNRLLNRQRGGTLAFLTLVQASMLFGMSLAEMLSPPQHKNGK